MNRSCVIAMIAGALLWVSAASAGIPTTAPAAMGPVSAYESLAIHSSRSAETGGTPMRSAAGTRNTDSSFGLGRVGLALGVVLALIFGMKWAGKRFLGLPAGGAGGGAMQVLGRSVIGPRQQLLMVKVGRRVLILGNSGAQLSCLSEIKNEDEVAELVSQAGRKSPAGAAFSSLFGRAGSQFKAEDAVAPVESEEESPAEAGAADPLLDPALATTREEIGGLMRKVQALARAYAK